MKLRTLVMVLALGGAAYAQDRQNIKSDDVVQSLERLSTGLRINRGKDDPAGLIASQRLDAEAKSLNQAIANANRADQVVNIAEGGLNEVSGLLTNLQGLLTSSASKAGLSKEEKDANQLQIDSILQTIDRVASATNFQGIKLLNGNLRRFPVPAGTPHGDRSVKEAVAGGIASLIEEHRQAVALFGSDTRASTLERAAERIKQGVVVTIFSDSAAKYLSESFWNEFSHEAEIWP